MCGIRDAVQNWGVERTGMMVDAGFRQGEYSACAFYRKQKNVRAGLPGDDFSVRAASESPDFFRGVIQQRVEVQLQSSLREISLDRREP